MDVLAMKRYMDMARMGMDDRLIKEGNGGMIPNEMFSQMNNNSIPQMNNNNLWMNNPMNMGMGFMNNVMMPRPMFPASVGGQKMRPSLDDAGADGDPANFRTLQGENSTGDAQHANNSMTQLPSKRRRKKEVKTDAKKLKNEASAKDSKLDEMPAKVTSLSTMDDKDYGIMQGTGVLQQHDLGGLSKCALCSKGEPTWFLVPCGHAALCDDCARYDSFFSCTESLPIEQCPACGEGLLDPYFMHLPMLELWLEAKVQKRGAGGLI
jgi:hypothetical protein